jgi:hypothetical protein
MRLQLILFTFLILGVTSLSAQNFVLLGGGFSAIFYGSDDLDEFTNSYNLVNQQNLLQPLDGLDSGMGIRWEIGYRYSGIRHYAVTGGYISYNEEDLANFSNGEKRRNTFELSTMYLEGEAGFGIDNFFITGVLGLYFNRKSELKSVYKSVSGESKALDGIYTSGIVMAADVGLAIGLYRHPFFLVGKITHPILTGGSEDPLIDERLEKTSEGTERFPVNFAEFLGKGSYKAVSSDIDGLKISIMISYAISVD